MTPLASYQAYLDNSGFNTDARQAAAARRLDDLYHACVQRPSKRPGLLNRLLGAADPQPIRGIYLWGGVGRGKTFLMDVFYDTLPFPNKLRLHFHRFMQRVHQDLRSLGEGPDPIPEVSRRFAALAQVICLDEMHINDITDAMIMGSLLTHLFDRGVTLVTTANTPPRGLYKNGLQRERFLPAIAQMEQHLQIIELDSPTDYRLRKLAQAQVYHHPLDAAADAGLAANYQAAIAVNHPKPDNILINQRRIPVVKWTDGVAWFDFAVLCNAPRSQLDYLEIAQYFHTVLLQNIPTLSDAQADQTRRLIHVVDTCYDANVKLLISAAAPPPQLYHGERLSFEFQRTISRLIEMQSQAYLARPHLAS